MSGRPRDKRIGIDARFYGLGSAGLARYTRELIENLARLRASHTFVVFMRPEDAGSFPHRSRRFEVRTTRTPHYTFREQLLLSSELARADLDLMHFTNFNLPLGYRRPFVVTIHDLTLLRYAGRSRASKLKLVPMRRVLKAGLTRSRAVIAISQYQRQLIERDFTGDPSKVHVIYEAVDSRFTPLPKAAMTAFRRGHGLADPFVMYTGQWREHKNLVRLLKAFAVLRKRHSHLKLVLVGKRDPAFPIIPGTIRSLGLSDSVICTGFVDDAELPKYYNAARAFAFPSLAEGFGLPPLEAMACGTPVAASSAPPMPEILGNAAVFFNPHNTADVAQVVERALFDAGLRRTLRRRGAAQVAKYSWQRTARETLAVYEAALR